MTKWTYLLIWNVVLTMVVAWLVIGRVWETQTTQSLDYNLKMINQSLHQINGSIISADADYELSAIQSTLDKRLREIDSTLSDIYLQIYYQ